MLVYVDDILLLDNNSTLVDELMDRLSSEFRIRDLGKPKFFLGIEVVFDDDALIFLQCQYMLEVLQKVSMEYCKPLAMPMSASVSNAMDDTSPRDNHTPYKQLVGSLVYMLVKK